MKESIIRYRKLDIEYVLINNKLNMDDLSFIGKGKSAEVYKINGKDKVIKIFYEHKIHELIKEKEAYKLLTGKKGFINMYKHGRNYLILDFVEGKNLFDCLINGIEIKKEYMDYVNDCIKISYELGLNPNDVHLKNIILKDNDEVVIVDLARFLDKKSDQRWDHIYRIYNNVYKKNWMVKRKSLIVIKALIFGYKMIEKISRGRISEK